LLSGWLFLKERILRRIFGGIKVNEIWKKRYNKELMCIKRKGI
jgi:lambda repressor-like predicted transcriptional regulator